MRVLITGGAGFVGSHCVDRFLREGAEVVVLDNLDPQVHLGAEYGNLADRVACQQLHFIHGDVRDRDCVRLALQGVTAVVHLSAAVGVGQSMYKPDYYVDVNLRGQAVLMEEMAADAVRWQRLVVASSMSIYGEGQYRCQAHGLLAPPPRSDSQIQAGEFEITCPQCSQPVEPVLTPEEKPLQSTSVYAITKKTQEELALCFGAAYRIPTVALRFFNIYGSRQSLSNPYTGVMAIFMSRLMNGNPPLIFEDGLQSRDFIHVFDVADAVWRATTQKGPANAVYNVCTGRATTVHDVALLLRRRLSRDIPPQILGKARIGDIRHCIGDPRRAEEGLGFRARFSLEEGLQELLEWAAERTAADLTPASLEELKRAGLLR